MRNKRILALAAGFLLTGCTQTPTLPTAVPAASPETERIAGTKLTDDTISAMFKRRKSSLTNKARLSRLSCGATRTIWSCCMSASAIIRC